MYMRFLAQTKKAIRLGRGNSRPVLLLGELLAFFALIFVLAIPVTKLGAEEYSLSLLGRGQQKTESVDQSRQAPQSQQEMLLSFSDVVKKTSPAVVNIYTKQIVRERPPGLFNDPFFQHFFGGKFPARKRQKSSLGSGVISTEDGLVVTNYHVIKGATEIKVVLADRREFNADLVLEDEATDLAILRIDAGQEKLPTLVYQDSDKVEVGDLVLAIGNPFGVGQTVTSGIVSALARTHVGVSDYQFFIQTDAAINPGNSGGALVTTDGRLLGINSAIFSNSGGSIGIGFAIPANMVQTVLASAVGGQDIRRAWSGMTGQTLTGDLAEGFGLDRAGGVLVTKIYPGGPADGAGLQKGDVILGFDGLEVTDLQSLRFRIATAPLGQDADLRVWRNRGELSLQFEAVSAPETPPANPETLQGNTPLTGARIANLSPSLSESLEMTGEWYGVVIIDVVSQSPAKRLGLRKGDIILTVDGVEIRDIRDIKRGLRRRTPKWDITIKRNGQVQNVKLDR